MLKRVGLIAVAASVAALAVVASGFARPATVAAASASAAASCKSGVSIGMLAPITGPVSSIGDDQLHWAEYYFTT